MQSGKNTKDLKINMKLNRFILTNLLASVFGFTIGVLLIFDIAMGIVAWKEYKKRVYWERKACKISDSLNKVALTSLKQAEALRQIQGRDRIIVCPYLPEVPIEEEDSLIFNP